MSGKYGTGLNLVEAHKTDTNGALTKKDTHQRGFSAVQVQ